MIELNILDGTSIFVDAFKLEDNHFELKYSGNHGKCVKKGEYEK